MIAFLSGKKNALEMISNSFILCSAYSVQIYGLAKPKVYLVLAIQIMTLSGLELELVCLLSKKDDLKMASNHSLYRCVGK